MEYKFFFEKNIQGDITAVYNTSGTKVISYAYDAWGNFTETIHNSSGSNAYAQFNPFRYRGYYYDTDTGLYYLQTRYYNPVWGRFLNADGQLNGGLLGYNMFAYCGNNPVNNVDPSGEAWWHWALGITAAVAVAALTAVTLGAAAPAAACTLTMMGTYVGMSYATASTLATVAVATTTVVASAYAGDMALSTFTGESVLLDTVFQGNEELYNAGAFVTTVATAGMIELAQSGPGACFVAGTLIATENGLVPVEKITAGELVYANNPDTGETALKRVARTFVKETDELVHIIINNEEITCTNEHPFYSPVKGWTAAYQLRVGDILVTVNGDFVVVEQVQHELLESPVRVFNFEVEDFHTYYVGNDSVLVHNDCGNKTRIGNQKGSAPRNNQAQNKQFNDIIKEYGLTDKQARRLHDSITGRGLGRDDIINELISIFPNKRK